MLEIICFIFIFEIDQFLVMKCLEDYFLVIFLYNGENWDVKVKVCGCYCCCVCDFFFLKLKLNKDMLEVVGLQCYNKFKLVMYCFDNFDNSDNVLCEYLVYEFYCLMIGEGYCI